jgi:hypothetical protein
MRDWVKRLLASVAALGAGIVVSEKAEASLLQAALTRPTDPEAQTNWQALSARSLAALPEALRQNPAMPLAGPAFRTLVEYTTSAPADVEVAEGQSGSFVAAFEAALGKPVADATPEELTAAVAATVANIDPALAAALPGMLDAIADLVPAAARAAMVAGITQGVATLEARYPGIVTAAVANMITTAAVQAVATAPAAAATMPGVQAVTPGAGPTAGYETGSVEADADEDQSDSYG